jgi:hypothetical protein
MKITNYSKNRIMESAHQWSVDREYYDPLYNYLVMGWSPGGFWTAVLSNDFYGAIQRSHPANQIAALKKASGWIGDRFPRSAWGTFDRVDRWLSATDEERRLELEKSKLIYTEHEEVEMALRGVDATELQVLW